MKTTMLIMAAALVVATVAAVGGHAPADLLSLAPAGDVAIAITALAALKQKQHELKAEATELLDAADADEGRDLTDKEEKRYAEIEAELKTVGEDIAKEEAKAERRRNLDAIRTAPPSGGERQPAAQPAIAPIAQPAQQNYIPAAQQFGRGLGFQALTGGGITRLMGLIQAALPNVDPLVLHGNYQNIAEFAVDVRNACAPGGVQSQKLRDFSKAMKAYNLSNGNPVQAAPTNYHEGGGSSGEGYELPVIYRELIWELVFALDDVFTTTDLEPTEGRQVGYYADETTPWGNTGVSANWRAEGSQMSASKLASKGRTMDLHELYAFVLATEELLEDSARLATRMTTKAAQAINWKLNDSVINGDGAGKPKGWMDSSALVTVAKESGQTANTIVAANVLKMFSRLWMAPGDMPYWLTNPDTVPQLATMTIGDQPVWMPPNGLIQAPGGILLGKPVRFSEHAKTLGTKGDIQLVSPKGYYAARRTQGVNFASSIHLYFDYAIEAFRWMFRFGGQPHLSAPVDPANGTSTKSHFVTLNTRA